MPSRGPSVTVTVSESRASVFQFHNSYAYGHCQATLAAARPAAGGRTGSPGPPGRLRGCRAGATGNIVTVLR